MRRPLGEAIRLASRLGGLGSFGTPFGKIELAVLGDGFCQFGGDSRSAFFGSVNGPKFKLHRIDPYSLVTSIGLHDVAARKPSLLFSFERVGVNDPARGL